MTDNSQWQQGQQGQPSPPPSNTPEPYAGKSPQSQPSPQAGQSSAADGTPQGGAWQGQQGGAWQGQQAYGSPQGYGQQGYDQQGYGNQQVDGEERTWMILAHLSAPIALILSAGWLSMIGPLLVWFMKKDSSPRVRQAAAGAFNFNLAFWLMAVIGWICIITIILIPVGVVLLIIVFVVAAYAHLRGAWLASKGEVYTYPFQIRVLS